MATKGMVTKDMVTTCKHEPPRTRPVIHTLTSFVCPILCGAKHIDLLVVHVPLAQAHLFELKGDYYQVLGHAWDHETKVRCHLFMYANVREQN